MSKKNLKNGKNKMPKFDKEKAEKEFRIGAYKDFVGRKRSYRSLLFRFK